MILLISILFIIISLLLSVYYIINLQNKLTQSKFTSPYPSLSSSQLESNDLNIYNSMINNYPHNILENDKCFSLQWVNNETNNCYLQYNGEFNKNKFPNNIISEKYDNSDKYIEINIQNQSAKGCSPPRARAEIYNGYGCKKNKQSNNLSVTPFLFNELYKYSFEGIYLISSFNILKLEDSTHNSIVLFQLCPYEKNKTVCPYIEIVWTPFNFKDNTISENPQIYMRVWSQGKGSQEIDYLIAKSNSKLNLNNKFKLDINFKSNNFNISVSDINDNIMDGEKYNPVSINNKFNNYVIKTGLYLQQNVSDGDSSASIRIYKMKLNYNNLI